MNVRTCRPPPEEFSDAPGQSAEARRDVDLGFNGTLKKETHVESFPREASWGGGAARLLVRPGGVPGAATLFCGGGGGANPFNQGPGKTPLL
jgi:hypothetical protein